MIAARPTVVSTIVLLCGVASAQVAPPGSGDVLVSMDGFDGTQYSTRFKVPKTFITLAPTTPEPTENCSWQMVADPLPDPLEFEHGPGIHGISGDDDFEFTGWEINIACSYGQVFAGANAGDNENINDDGTGSAVHTGDQVVKLKRTDTSGCGSVMSAKIKPKFTIFTNIENGATLHTEDVFVKAGSYLTIPEIDSLQAVLDGQIDQQDDGSTAVGSWQGPGGVATPIPLPDSGDAQRKIVFVHPLQAGTKEGITEAEVTAQTSLSVTVDADGWIQWPFWDNSEVEGFAYDSYAGTRVEGNCVPAEEGEEGCIGDAVLSVSWYGTP